MVVPFFKSFHSQIFMWGTENSTRVKNEWYTNSLNLGANLLLLLLISTKQKLVPTGEGEGGPLTL